MNVAFHIPLNDVSNLNPMLFIKMVKKMDEK